MNTIIKSIVQNYGRIEWDDYFMSTSLLISSRSPCDRLHVGCVLVKNNRIISAGYNGFLSGAKHKSIIENDHEQATVHAEQNALSDCANRGVSTKGAIAYITHYPCINCFKILVSGGINKIIYLEDYKNDVNIQIIIDSMENKIEIIKLN